MATVGDVAGVCDRLWPAAWAESWDNVGLLLGARGDTVTRCYCALDADGVSIEAAAAAGAQMLVSHHPLPFRPLRRLTDDDAAGSAVLGALRHRIALYAAHTNFDVHPQGVNAALAAALGLREPALLQVTGRQSLHKLVIFVPVGHEDAVMQAVCGAGAGHLGQYSECSFAAPGTGTFRPLPGAQPFVGSIGALRRQEELRLEVLVPADRVSEAVAAMLRAHPYEEVAYDLIRLENPGPARGLGMVGLVPSGAVRLAAFAAAVAQRLHAPATRFVGDPARLVRQVAVCGGAGTGAGCIQAALAAGADVLVTADVRYHEAREAEVLGLGLVDPGHQATEAPAVPVLAEMLRGALAAAQLGVDVVTEGARPDVWRVPRDRAGRGHGGSEVAAPPETGGGGRDRIR